MSTPPASVPFDARPLTEPVTAATARAYVRQMRQEGRAPSRNVVGVIVGVVIGVAFITIFGASFVSILLSIFTSATGAGGGAGAAMARVIPAVMILLILVGAVLGVSRWFRNVGAARWYRLDRFANANGLRWFPQAVQPPLPGLIFGVGHSRTASDILRGDHPRFVEFGNYSYKTGSGKNESTHTWGYMAVKLNTPLPHIVLDAVGNNGLFGASNLPAAFQRDQRLRLEGDFDRYFSLYCPEGYETDALYLFTPDIMARFIDNAAMLDVEIVDDWLFLYSGSQMVTLDPARWAWQFSVVAALLDKIAQWERWRDDRLTHAAQSAAPIDTPRDPADTAAALPFAAPTGALRPPPGVAPQGRRLARGVSWPTIILAGAIFAIVVIAQLGGFTAILGSMFR